MNIARPNRVVLKPRDALYFLRKHLSGAIGVAIVGGFCFVALAAPLLEPYSDTAKTCKVFAAPSARHLLGCDDGGIDVLSELIAGTRVSLIVGFAATLVATVLGGGVGLASGYFGGWIDIVLMRITDYFLVIPDLVLMIVIADIWGPSLFHVIMVIGILLWTWTARVVRSQVKSVREAEYVKRTQSLGAGHVRLIARHILPHVAPLLIANIVLTIAVAVLDETALAFLGLSDPTRVTWGKIIEFAYLQDAALSGAWWVIVPPGVCIVTLIMGCFLIGKSIEDALNPRLRVSYISPRQWRLRDGIDSLSILGGLAGQTNVDAEAGVGADELA